MHWIGIKWMKRYLGQYTQMLESRQNLEIPFKEVAAILKTQDSTKLRKTGPAQLNLTWETFHESQVLNREARITRLEERLSKIANINAKRAAKKNMKNANSKASKAAKKQVQRAKEEEDKPVLLWLEDNNYAPEGATTIKKAHMLAAYNDQKQLITDIVKNGGTSSTSSPLWRKWYPCLESMTHVCEFYTKDFIQLQKLNDLLYYWILQQVNWLKEWERNKFIQPPTPLW